VFSKKLSSVSLLQLNKSQYFEKGKKRRKKLFFKKEKSAPFQNAGLIAQNGTG
jgi:hypothetical protein